MTPHRGIPYTCNGICTRLRFTFDDLYLPNHVSGPCARTFAREVAAGPKIRNGVKALRPHNIISGISFRQTSVGKTIARMKLCPGVAAILLVSALSFVAAASNQPGTSSASGTCIPGCHCSRYQSRGGQHLKVNCSGRGLKRVPNIFSHLHNLQASSINL